MLDDPNVDTFQDNKSKSFDPNFNEYAETSPLNPRISSAETKKVSLLAQFTPFDEEAVNAEFQEEYETLEQRARQLDLDFQYLIKDLRLWICSSVDPVSEEAKRKIAEEVEIIKTMETKQENMRLRIVDCMKAMETALSIINQAQDD